jgi:hypothetical protein
MSTRITEEHYTGAADENCGWCRSCKDFTTYEVEPDAERYECDDCGAPRVYGAEQALPHHHPTHKN